MQVQITTPDCSAPLDIECEFSPARPGLRLVHPDHCTPDEPETLEITGIVVRGVDITLLVADDLRRDIAERALRRIKQLAPIETEEALVP